jgi:hypothetical protein
LALLEIFPGCSSLIGATLEAGANSLPVLGSPPGPDSHRTGKNHYEPVILYSTKGWIRIKYLSVGPNAEHEKVIQLIFEHCDGTYIETIRAELRGYTTVEAECTHGNESIQ